MHELSIADMLINQIQNAIAHEGLVQVSEVTIKVGTQSELNVEDLEEALVDQASHTSLRDAEFSLLQLQPGRDAIFDGEIAISPGDDLPPQSDVWGSSALDRSPQRGPRVATGREIVVSRIDGMHRLDEGGTRDFDEGYLNQ